MRHKLLPGYFLATLLTASCTTQATPPPLQQQWQQARAQHYLPPDDQHISTAQKLFSRHFNGEWGSELRREWEELGYRAEEQQHPQQRVIVIAEPRGQLRGRGLYLFFPDNRGQTALQAPHGE